MAFAPSLWGPQRIANPVTGGSQGTPSIVGLADGRFAMAWTSLEPVVGLPFTPLRLRVQTFDAFGNAAGPNPSVDNVLPFDNETLGAPDLAAGPAGSFVLAWTRAFGGGPSDVAAQGFASDGSALVGRLSVASGSAPGSPLADAQVAAGPAGLVLVDFTDPTSTGGDLRQRPFDGPGLNGGGGPVTTVNAGTAGAQGASDIAFSGARALVVFESEVAPGNRDILARAVDAATGAPLGPDLILAGAPPSERNPVVAGLGGGAFAVAYEAGGEIRALLVSAGNAVTDLGPVNTSAAGAPVNPAITALPDGSFFVAWQDPGGGAAGADIRGQLFGPTGTRIGAEITLTGAGDQTDPTVGALADGRVVVAWTEGAGSPNGDGSGSGIATVILETRGAVIYGTTGSDVVIGTDAGAYADNTLTGLAGDDLLYGLGGNDVLVGNEGNDYLIGGLGNDMLYGGPGLDTLYGGEGNDVLLDTEGASGVMVGGAGNDTIYGNGGDDYIVGDDGDDVLYGHGGQDSLYGGAGNDYIVAGFGVGSVLDGGAGANTLYGGFGNDYIVGGELPDLAVGGRGSDYLFGNAGDDTLYGGQGTDYIYTNAGNDFVWTDDVGSPASTDYVYAGGGTGVDTIADFTAGSGQNADVLVISPASGIGSFAQAQAAMSQVGVYTVLTMSGGDQVYLYNVSPGQMTAGNFLFF